MVFHTHEILMINKKEKLQIYPITWMNSNMLSDRRQTQKHVLCDSSFMNLEKTNLFGDWKSRLMAV